MNLNYLYYKKYYDGLLGCEIDQKGTLSQDVSKTTDDKSWYLVENIKKSNEIMREAKAGDWKKEERYSPECESSFALTVGYPGLMAGIGIMHEIGLDEALKTGICLDYVTGQPYIQASTVKGTLEFPFRGDRWIYIASKMNWKEDGEEKTKELKRLIFGSGSGEAEGGCGQDTFFNAVFEPDEDKKITLFGKESITPHPDRLKDPIPISMLKINPGNRIWFYFWLHDSELTDGTVVTAKQKEQLFKDILLGFGIGAKTNVGFGVLEES